MIKVTVKQNLEISTAQPGVRIVTGGAGPMGPRAAQELCMFIQGHVETGEQLLRYTTKEFRVWSPTLTRGEAEEAATSEAIFTLTKNGLEWGSITFGEGSDEAVAEFLDDDNITQVDDVIRVFAPSPSDPTLAGVTIILAEELEP